MAHSSTPAPTHLLAIDRLTIGFPDATGRTLVPVVRDVSLWVDAGEMVGLVGESGSGKTQTALAVLGLTREPGRVISGRVELDGTDVVNMPAEQLRDIRGRQAAMIFQSPRTSLNPLMTIGQQISRVYQRRRGLSKPAARTETLAILKRVGVAGPARVAESYPHQLSGGMAQRVMIGMMLACDARLLIADEPTTGLDVTIQAQIFDLIAEVRDTTKMAVLLITHDLGVVAELCDRVIVMQAGRVVEMAPVDALFATPFHPYTRRLLGSVVHLGSRSAISADVVPIVAGARSMVAADVAAWRTRRVSPPEMVEVEAGHWVCAHERAFDAEGAA